MANARRGEVEAVLAGRRYTLCLTLGSLAELETAFAAGDLSGLAERLSGGRFSARDLLRIVGAGLRGAAQDLTEDELLALPATELPEIATVAAALLAAAFGAPAGDPR